MCVRNLRARILDLGITTYRFVQGPLALLLVLVDIGDLGFADRFVRGGRVHVQTEPFSLVQLSLLCRLVAADGMVESFRE